MTVGGGHGIGRRPDHRLIAAGSTHITLDGGLAAKTVDMVGGIIQEELALGIAHLSAVIAQPGAAPDGGSAGDGLHVGGIAFRGPQTVADLCAVFQRLGSRQLHLHALVVADVQVRIAAGLCGSIAEDLGSAAQLNGALQRIHTGTAAHSTGVLAMVAGDLAAKEAANGIYIVQIHGTTTGGVAADLAAVHIESTVTDQDHTVGSRSIAADSGIVQVQLTTAVDTQCAAGGRCAGCSGHRAHGFLAIGNGQLGAGLCHIEDPLAGCAGQIMAAQTKAIFPGG